MTSQNNADALRGAVELLALKTLSHEPMHGWGIALRIQQVSENALEVNQGTLYPALQRMETRGLVTSRWGTTENGRRARFYELTSTGRKALEQQETSWRAFTAGVDLILGTS